MAQPESKPLASLNKTDESLKRLDRQDWWRWSTASLVTLLLTAGVFFLSLPALRRDMEEQRALDIGVSSLFAIVLLFDVFAVYQQIVISRLRRELMTQVGMSATLELLREPDAAAQEGRNRKRKFPRFHFDQRISVTYVVEGKERRVYGRTSDLSEGGLGAVIPETLAQGTNTSVEVALGAPDLKLTALATVRQQRGFHHCMEFVNLSAEQAEQIRAACVGATPVADYHRDPVTQ